MKQLYKTILVSFLILLATNTLMAQAVNIDLEEPYGDEFTSSQLLQSVSFIPLSVERPSMIMQDMEMKYVDGQYFVLDNKFLQCVYRFDSLGNFLNTIGGEQLSNQRTNEPVLTNPIKFTVNPYLQQVEIYNFEESEIRRYNYDGKRIERISMSINPADFIRDKTGNYWIYMGWKNSETAFRLLRADKNGKITERQMRLITKCSSIESYAFYENSNNIYLWELLGNKTYHITNKGINESFVFNYGTYALPERYHQLDANESIQLINKNGYFAIKKYLENENFAYFYINFTSPDQREMLHVIYDKKLSKPHILSENAAIGAFDKAQALTDNDELVFLVAPRRMRQLFSGADAYVPEVFYNISQEINNIRFPVVMKIKLTSVESYDYNSDPDFNYQQD